MALTVDREGPSRNWMRLDPDHLDRKLVALGLYQNTPEPALICRQCKYALKPSAAAVSKHLWEKHQISKDARKGLVPFVKSLTLPDPNQLPLRRDASLPHPHLAVQQGMACRRCTFRSTSGDLVRRHLSSVHGIKNNRQTWLRDDVRDRLSLQSWTQNGQRQYWIVANEDQTGLASTAADATYSPRRRRRVAELHEDQYRRITADAQSRSTTDLGLDDLASVSNWMRRTNWAATFAGADRLLLLLLTEKPAANGHRLLLGLYGTTEVYSSIDDERRLVAIGKAVDHFLDRCEDTARNTDHSLRCWLRSQVPGHSYKAPFELLGRTRTMIRYRGYWKRLIYFVFRLYRLDDVYRDSLHAQLSCKQRKAVEEVWTTLQSDFTASRSNTGIEDPSLNPPRYRATARSNSSSDSCSSLDVEVDPSGVTLAAQRFTRALSKLPSTLGPLDEVDELDQISSSFDESSLDTESSSADSDEARDSDETKESDHVTIPMQVARERSQGIIPALLKCTSLSLLANDVGAAPSGSTTTPTTQEEEEQLADLIGRLSVFFCMEEFTDSRSSSTMIVYFSGILGFSPSGTTFERPRNYTPKLSALIYCIRLCLLEASLPRFAHPLIGWKVRAPSGNLKRLNRVRERFMCLGCQAPMGELLSLRSYGRAISRSDGPSFRVQWSNDSETVMWNGAKLSMKHFRQLGHHAVQTATTLIARLMYGVRPTIRLGSIRDSISNVAQGYSFIQDPANGLATAYLDLSTRACLDPLDGLMLSERWNYPAVHRYLKEEADLLVQVMLIMYLRGGQAPRLTELFSIECYNGSSTSRGVYIHAGTIVYVTRHSKARRSTNQEFQIARYLSHGDSELVAQYLIYVRPFAEMLRRECLGGTDGRRLLFSSSETPEQAWKTVVLTKALKKLSVDICEEFYLDIYETIQDEGEPDYDRLDEESIAIWLTRPTKEENTTGSAEIIEIFKAWTKTVQENPKEVARIKREVEETSVIRDPADFELIQELDEPIPGLKLYHDAWTCTAETTCHFTALATRTLKNHCATQHRGARVSCQQMFPAQHGSNYFRIGPLTLAEDDEAVPIDAATKARQRVRDAQQAMERRTIREVEDRREGTEFVPWLERMGWPTYLRGLDRQVLIGLVKTPDTEEEPLVAM
ncbi:hypothetical protein Q9189_008167, partial [Teloschistes chrysophthalmus]